MLLSSQVHSEKNLKIQYRQSVDLIETLIAQQYEIRRLQTELERLRGDLWEEGAAE